MRAVVASMAILVGSSLAMGITPATAAPAVFTTDFIANGDRTNFNSFETAPDPSLPLHIFDGIRVEQVNADPGASIWTTFFTPDGNRGWYPNGGDNGYTRITRVDGSDFIDAGFFRSTGASLGWTLYYLLRDNGAQVLSGQLPQPQNGGIDTQGLYLGFSGGGFDEILIRDSGNSSDSFFSGTLNALALDAIELAGSAAVPEPGTIALVATGLLGLRWARRRNPRV